MVTCEFDLDELERIALAVMLYDIDCDAVKKPINKSIIYKITAIAMHEHLIKMNVCSHCNFESVCENLVTEEKYSWWTDCGKKFKS